MAWHYEQIKSLKQARKDERIVACYDYPGKNFTAYKDDERLKEAVEDSKQGKCKLLVWREFDYNPKDIEMKEVEKKGMTVRELYEWAKERDLLDNNIVIMHGSIDDDHYLANADPDCFGMNDEAIYM